MKTAALTLKSLTRRSLISMVALTFAISVWTGVGHAAVLGDCNGDGQVRAADALLALQYATSLIPHNATNDSHYLTCADVFPLDANLLPVGDGQIRAADALVILQRAVNLLTFSVNIPSAIIKLSTSGTLPAGTTIGAIQLTVNYPTSKALTIFDTDITGATGNGSSTSCGPANQNCYMLVANTTTVFGKVDLALINPTGIAAVGEIAKLNFHTAPGNASPVSGDFTITGASVYDVSGVLIPGVSVVISAAAIQ